ncbi:lipocalin-like domain-containing protein [Rathayibacter festucae]|uniref:Uncharacterized protein n=1 Tax=Rathayibacter festucae DSM 15932 TaxID=1328866 RepID=A0A3Q9UZ82_9MICO|nr:lipocalin-like domain-containing protein [Rathayibacter festucae]AZZ51798.1 hypothetical protein C1I64_06890 [Rathayibacter festucae DSM 15932]
MTTRRLIAPALAAGLLATLTACSTGTGSAEQDPAESTASAGSASPVGTWSMTLLEDSAAGEFQSIPYSGQIVITPSTVSVQAMNPDTTAPDGPYTIDGYEAFYGPATIDDDEDTFSVDVESAAVRELIGQTLTRSFEVTDDTLVLTPTDPAETWRVSYERVTD